MKLRAIREERGLTLTAAARQLNRTPSALSKLETGQRGIYRPSLENMLDRYEVTDEEKRETIFALARDSSRQGWWRGYDHMLLPATTDLISLEDDAAEIRIFEVIRIPGLLQTPAYAHAMLAGGIAAPSASDADRLVSIRMKRQRILTRPEPPRLWAVIGEAALRQIVGDPGIMRDQLHRLLDVARLDHVTLQVLPHTTGAHPGLDGSFVILDVGRRSELPVVHAQGLTRSWFLEDDQAIREHRLAFDRIATTARSETDSRAMIERVLSELPASADIEGTRP